MMKLVSHAPVDAAADQVECITEIVTVTTYLSFRKVSGPDLIQFLTSFKSVLTKF